MSEFVNSELGNWIFGFCYGLGIGALVTDWVKRPRRTKHLTCRACGGSFMGRHDYEDKP